MARWTLRQEWITLMENRLSTEKDFEYTSDFTLAMQWIIQRLDKNKTPFRLFNLGAGVKKITTKVDTCPKCHGTGKY